MKDRQPLKPNRVLIKPEDGSAPYYATVTRADEPVERGDPLSKNTFFKDSTAALYGMDTTAVPDDAFVSILNYALHGLYRYDLTIIIDNMPLANVEVSGLTAVDGSAVYTDESGKVIGFAGASTTITFPKYADLTEFSFGVAKENMVTTKTLTGQRTIEVLTLSASKVYQFSPQVLKASFCAIGGGAGGGGGFYDNNGVGAGGGGGGYISNLLHHDIVPNTDYIFTVGAGGGGGTNAPGYNHNGKNGGASSISLHDTVILSAKAGKAGTHWASGGTGNGNGGNSNSAGTDGSGYIFNAASYGSAGGGGGGGADNNTLGASGGAPYGGRGGATAYGSADPSGGRHGGYGTGYGGGGGGGNGVDGDHTGGAGGGGHKGAILIRFDQFKEAA